MKLCLLFSLYFFAPFFLFGQSEEVVISEIKAYQEKLNAEFADKKSTPLLKPDWKKFEGLPFFPIDLSYRVTARFVKNSSPLPFKMLTTTERRPVYEPYAEVHFELNGKQLILPVYQSHDLKKTKEYKTYLFLPFTDLTNGNETYGGGRYLGLEIPDGDEIVIDFNKAYNPYCAYNPEYSCPIPPEENHIELEIKAGVMAPEKQKE